MIYRVSSSLPTFKTLNFRSGLNILIAKKEEKSSNKQTRNRAGKSSLIEIIHFLTGAKVEKNSLFKSKALENESFDMKFGVGNEIITVQRSCKKPKNVHIVSGEIKDISNNEWISFLGNRMFGLSEKEKDISYSPTFRSLFSYFVRRQSSGAFATPEKQAYQQQPYDYQTALMFLLGLDWKIASDWQVVRDREKTLTELKKAAGTGEFLDIIGKTSDLRTQLAVSEAALDELKKQISSFKVLPKYRELEIEANNITQKINELANENVIDTASISDYEKSLQTEAPPTFNDLEQVYNEIGIVIPDLVKKRYEEVHSFHLSVVKNRKDYIESELQASKRRIQLREQEKAKLDQRRSEIMNLLKSHGALDQFSRLQEEASRLEAEVESLRKRYEAAEKLESTKNILKIERNNLVIRLGRDFNEQQDKLTEAIVAYEKISKQLYESAGSMVVDKTENGPVFQFPMQGSRSKGIKNMQIFCFDMMLMTLCRKRNIGPGFLVHDSHLFDGVDGRQIISALKIGAEIAETLDFQYIVTINEDDAFKENVEDFDVNEYVLPVVLTDSKEDGGLFGFRF
jgi:uncharacterized protein YydD (DUF2326 family)